MGILGGSRIDSLTIFLAVTLIMYSILSSAVFATFEGVEFVDPFSGKTFDIDLGEEYEFNDVKNVTVGGILEYTSFTELNPDRNIAWYRIPFQSGKFQVTCQGKNLWDSWTQFNLKPEELTESQILTVFDNTMNFSKFIYNQGGEFETAVFYCPQFYYNETSEQPTYLYDSLEESFDNDIVTVIMATNATYVNYDIGRIFGVLSGFSTYGMPYEVSVLLGGIFWVLLLLTLVKLVVG